MEMKTVTDFTFLGSKITADGNCSHEIKTLAPWKQSYDQPRKHIKKQYKNQTVGKNRNFLNPMVRKPIFL